MEADLNEPDAKSGLRRTATEGRPGVEALPVEGEPGNEVLQRGRGDREERTIMGMEGEPGAGRDLFIRSLSLGGST